MSLFTKILSAISTISAAAAAISSYRTVNISFERTRLLEENRRPVIGATESPGILAHGLPGQMPEQFYPDLLFKYKNYGRRPASGLVLDLYFVDSERLKDSASHFTYNFSNEADPDTVHSVVHRLDATSIRDTIVVHYTFSDSTSGKEYVRKYCYVSEALRNNPGLEIYKINYKSCLSHYADDVYNTLFRKVVPGA